jgi:hypothetical protein
MKSNQSFLKRQNLLWVLILLLVVLVADPLGILKGNFSQDSYTQIRNELSEYNKSKVLLIGSWDDFYSLEYNNYWRKEVNTDFVERNYSEALDAASLGDDFFNKYLNSKGITHILVPQTTFNRGAINHKFGNRGSIDIKLVAPFFMTGASSTGPFPSVLLRVGEASEVNSKVSDSKYEITWENVDWWFYTKQTKKIEVGLYNYSYSTFYEWGPDVSWFYDYSPERPNALEIFYRSTLQNLERVMIQLTLVAAYGPNAPEHVVSVSTDNYSETKTLSPNNPGVFQFTLEADESVLVRNVTPCRIPSVFEPADLSIYKICFGVSKLSISPENLEE